MIRFDCTKDEALLIEQIVKRTEEACKRHGIPFGSVLNAEMDVTVCHMNGCKLDLNRMAEANDGDLLHDMLGICKHLDRATGKLTGMFDPRHSLQEATA